MILSMLRLFYRIYPKYIFLTIKEIKSMFNILNKKIINSKYNPEVIIAVKKGGLFPGKYISNKLGIKLINIAFSSYPFYIFGTNIEYFPIITRLLNLFGYKRTVKLKEKLTEDIKNKNILLVDDDSNSGYTIKSAIKYLKKFKPNRIKTAVLCLYSKYDFIDFCVLEIYNQKGLKKRHRIMPWEEISPYYPKVQNAI